MLPWAARESVEQTPAVKELQMATSCTDSRDNRQWYARIQQRQLMSRV